MATKGALLIGKEKPHNAWERAEVINLRCLEKFHDISVKSTAVDLKTKKSSSFRQGLKLFLGPFFASGVVSQHYEVDVNDSFGGEAGVGCYGKNAFSHNHLAVLRQRIVAILQEFEAVVVAPIVADPLHRVC